MSQPQPPDGLRPDTGEYPLAPETPPPMRMARPIQVRQLEYRSAADSEKETSHGTGWQFTGGVFYFYLCAVLLAFVLNATKSYATVLGWTTFGICVAVASVIQMKYQWRGFVPGVLSAIFFLPLVGLLLCGAVGIAALVVSVFHH